MGRLTAVTDRNGNTTAYGYDAQDRLTTVTDPAGLVTTLAYDGAGKLASVTDPAARVTLFDVDGAGDLTRIEDPDGSERFFAYDARHLLVSQTSKRGFGTTYDYGFHGRNLQANRPDLSTRKVTPAEVVGLADLAAGQGTEAIPAPYVRPSEVVASFTDGNNNTTTFELDPFGGATRITNALSRVMVIERDGNGLVTRVTHPNTRIDERAYDGNGNLLSKTDAVGTAIALNITFEYDPLFNQVTKIIDPELNETILSYDGSGNLSTVTNSEMMVTQLSYGDSNCPGLVTSATIALGLPEEASISYSFDPNICNATTILDALNNPVNLVYDSVGNITQTTDPLGRVTRAEFDSLSRATKIIDATNVTPEPDCSTDGVTCITYDQSGNVDSIIDPNGNATDFMYDELGRTLEIRDALFSSKSFIYDDDDRLTKITHRNGNTIDFVYNEVGERTKQIMNAGTPQEIERTFSYDLAGNILAIVDPDSALSFTYDLLSRETQASTAGSPFQPNISIGFTYDKLGNRLTLDDGLQPPVLYSYSTLSELETLTSASLGSFSFTHDAFSRRTSVSRPNLVSSAYTFDLSGRLSSLIHSDGVSTVSSFEYLYNELNIRTEVTQQRSALTVTSVLTFSYDDLDQLIAATHPLPAGPDETFTYDSAGNRLSRDGQVSQSVIGPGNRLQEDQESCYSYDLNGNMVSKVAKVAGACAGDTTDFIYDAENRLVEVQLPNQSVATYRYDGLWRRIEKNADGQISRYVYDNEDIIMEFDGSNALRARYLHGPGGDNPISMEYDIDSNSVLEGDEQFYFLSDSLGSVTDIVDNNGSVAQAYVYDAFGQIVQEIGNIPNSYFFTGRQFDSETGLYHYRARYYDPQSGRFTQEDPIGFISGDSNFYRYVFNNPVNLVDPDGLATAGVNATLEPKNDFSPIPLPNDMVAPVEIDPVLMEILIEQCRAPDMNRQTKGQRSLQKKLDRPGDKFSKEYGLDKTKKPPKQSDVEDIMKDILGSPDLTIETVGQTKMFKEGGFKLRKNGPESPGIGLDPGGNFLGFLN